MTPALRVPCRPMGNARGTATASLGALLAFATQISNGSRFSVEPSRGKACNGPQLKRTVHKGGGPKFSSGAKRKRVSAANGRKFHPCRLLSKTSNADRRRARSQIGYTSMRSGSEFGQADSPIGWVKNTPQQPPWLRGSRNCPLWDGANISRKTVALIRTFCENHAAGIDAKRQLACSGSSHRHDPKPSFIGRFRCLIADVHRISVFNPRRRSKFLSAKAVIYSNASNATLLIAIETAWRGHRETRPGA
jgi:hypothetical protein